MSLLKPKYKPSQFRQAHKDDRRGRQYMFSEHLDADPRINWINQREQDLVQHHLDLLPAGGIVCDVPCGNGRMSALVAKRGDLKLAAFDFNVDMLVGMGRRGEAQLLNSRAQADVLALPLKDASVDLLVNMRLMHHIPDRSTQVRMFREIRRVCRGTVITSFWTTRAWRYIRRRLIGKEIRGFPVSPEHFRAVCLEAGLEVTEFVPVRRWWEEQVMAVCRPVPGR